MTSIDRHFVRLAEGPVHYRSAGPRGAPPLLMLHASPGGAALLEPLMSALAGPRRLIAPDTLGNGDSAPLAIQQPELPDYANAMLRLLDTLGEDQVDVYGSHTGAHIAVEMAIAAPGRVRRLVLDGLGMWVGEERADLLARYAPQVAPDAVGSQMFWATQFVRDQAWFFPHYRRDAAHNRGGGAMSPEKLHSITVDVLKSVTTYHLAYRAVFRSCPQERLPLVAQPALVIADFDDPLCPGCEEAIKLLPLGEGGVLEFADPSHRTGEKAGRIERFLTSN